MVRLSDLSEDDRRHMLAKPCPVFEGAPFVAGAALTNRRVAVVTTAALQLRDDPPFDFQTAEYVLEKGMIDRVVHRRDLRVPGALTGTPLRVQGQPCKFKHAPHKKSGRLWPGVNGMWV